MEKFFKDNIPFYKETEDWIHKLPIISDIHYNYKH